MASPPSRQIGDFSPFSYLSRVIIARGCDHFFLIKNRNCNVLFNKLRDIFKINGHRCRLRRKRSNMLFFLSQSNI